MIKIIDDYIAGCKEKKKLLYAMTRRTETFIAPYVYFVCSVSAMAKNIYVGYMDVVRMRFFFFFVFFPSSTSFYFIIIIFPIFTEHLSVKLPPTVVLTYTNYLLFIYVKIKSKQKKNKKPIGLDLVGFSTLILCVVVHVDIFKFMVSPQDGTLQFSSKFRKMFAHILYD